MSNRKVIWGVGAVSAIFLGVMFNSVPDVQYDTPLEFNEHAAFACKSKVKDLLNDPDSMETDTIMPAAWADAPNGDRIVRIEFRAKNGFGALVKAQALCSYTPWDTNNRKADPKIKEAKLVRNR